MLDNVYAQPRRFLASAGAYFYVLPDSFAPNKSALISSHILAVAEFPLPALFTTLSEITATVIMQSAISFALIANQFCCQLSGINDAASKYITAAYTIRLKLRSCNEKMTSVHYVR